jgi:hypothetical protein
MTVDEVMQYRRAEPFKPFVLVLKDGREFAVNDPLEIGRDPGISYLMVDGGYVVRGTSVASVRLLDDRSGEGNVRGKA